MGQGGGNAASAFRDVTMGRLLSRLAVSYRLLESRVEERTRELSDALHQLKESESQLIQTEKMSSLGQMVAGIAHEINTPSSAINAAIFNIRGYFDALAIPLVAGRDVRSVDLPWWYVPGTFFPNSNPFTGMIRPP